MSVRFQAVAGAALVLASGCGVLGGYEPKVPVRAFPESLRATADAPAGAVALGGAPDDAAGRLRRSRTVTLSEVLTTAGERANAVIEAAARLEAASGRVQSADGALLPGVAIEVGGGYLDGRQVGSFGEVQDVSFGRFEPAAEIFYRVNPGAAWVRARAARDGADAAALDLREARRVAMLQGAVGYMDLALARVSQGIGEQLATAAEKFVAITEARAAAEIGSGAEVARARAAAATAQQAALRARVLWETASIRLAVLLRWDTDQLLVPLEERLRPGTLIDVSSADLVAEAELARPDILAAQARSEAAGREQVAAWWDVLGPEIDAGFRERFIGTDFDELGNTNLARGVARIGVDFVEIGRLRSAKAEAEVARVRARTLREQARGQVEAALSRVTIAEAAIPAALGGVSAAEESHAAELARFEAGTGLGLEVIQAQNAVAWARMELAQAIVRYDVAQLELAAGLGHLDPSLVEEWGDR